MDTFYNYLYCVFSFYTGLESDTGTAPAANNANMRETPTHTMLHLGFGALQWIRPGKLIQAGRVYIQKRLTNARLEMYADIIFSHKIIHMT